MNFKIIEIVIFLSCIGLLSCSSVVKLSDKTQKIKTQAMKIEEGQKQGVAIVTPFVLSGELSDIKVIKRIRDSLFDAYILPGQYKRNAKKEKSFLNTSIKAYKRYFRKRFYTYVPTYSDSDLSILKDEVKKLEMKLHDSALTSLKVSPSMTKVLANPYTTSSLFVITNITDYYVEGAYGVHRTYAVEWTLLIIFIIDLKRNDVTFYTYDLSTWLGISDVASIVVTSFRKPLREFKKNKSF